MKSLKDKIIHSLKEAGKHNRQIMAPPRVILWPDPEQQWGSIIGKLQENLPELLVFGSYDPDKKTGPAIWLKCMVDRTLPDVDWPESEIPIIYLPGISRRDLKNVKAAELELQPILEYQYTGNLWLHENGKEWTVVGFIQNEKGMGINVAQDNLTKETLIGALPNLINEPQLFYRKDFIDADFLLNDQYPNVGVDILKWMEEGDKFLTTLSSDKKQSFITICKKSYGFNPDVKNIKNIAYQLGSRRGPWAQIWEYFNHAPNRYQRVQEYLRLAAPDDLGLGMFEVPRDSWPQENEKAEDDLREELKNLSSVAPDEVLNKLESFKKKHSWREGSVWHELGMSPLLESLKHIVEMTKVCRQPYPNQKQEDLINYYVTDGYKADMHMRKALAAVNTNKDSEVITEVIQYIYKPWLEKLAEKFQDKFNTEGNSYKPDSDDEAVLFVDALRYDVAIELVDRLNKADFESSLEQGITAIPTVTPTAKPFNSPLSELIDTNSSINDFRPTVYGKDLKTQVFRSIIEEKGFKYVKTPKSIEKGNKYWLEIGDLDKKGHNEQANVVNNIDECIKDVIDTVKGIKEAGVNKLTIVTDHGWLLLPGGLPKAKITKELTETRWGRCAHIKEGASVDFPHYPWTWNEGTFLAYAPGISFFKANEEYAHGGISLQECIVPRINIIMNKTSKLTGKVKSVSWNQLICHVELEEASDNYSIDIRNKSDDESTSIVLSKPERRKVQENTARVMVDDSVQGQAAHVVLLNHDGVILDSKLTTVGGN